MFSHHFSILRSILFSHCLFYLIFFFLSIFSSCFSIFYLFICKPVFFIHFFGLSMSSIYLSSGYFPDSFLQQIFLLFSIIWVSLTNAGLPSPLRKNMIWMGIRYIFSNQSKTSIRLDKISVTLFLHQKFWRKALILSACT